MRCPLPLAAVLSSLLLPTAWAKQVSLGWEPLEGADHYEFVFEKAGKPISSFQLSSPKWKGELSPGFHVYRLRAIDEAGRPGDWSDPIPVIVMPEAPALERPTAREHLSLFTGEDVVLKWRAAEGFQRYQIEIKSGTQVVYRDLLDEPELRLGDIPAGEYSWTARGVILPESEYPSFAGKSWLSKASAQEVFVLERKTLARPVLTYPIGPNWPSSDGRIEFRWDRVSGAMAYEFRVKRVFDSSLELSQSGPDEPRVFRTEENFISVNVGAKGRYIWSVRALPTSSARMDSTPRRTTGGDASDSLQAESTAEFSLQNSELSIFPQWQVAFSSGYALLTSEDVDLSRNISGRASPTGILVNLGLEHWLSRELGLDLSLSTASFSIEGGNETASNVAVRAQRRFDLGYGWMGSLHMGASLVQVPSLAPQAGGTPTDISNVTLLGPSLDGGLRRLLSPRLAIQAEAQLYFPLLAPGISGTLSGVGLLDNISLGGKLLWVNSSRLAYDLTLSWQRCSASWAQQTAAPLRTATLQGFALAFGVVYQWGSEP